MKHFALSSFFSAFCFILLGILSQSLSAKVDLNLEYIEQIYIIGTKQDAVQLPGSGTVISNEDLKKLADTDIQKILLLVPGLYFRSEEGFGLRPNISIRGTAPDRSGKITIMEDGIPIAPAPYTAPAAYYFPTAGRIHAVEVLKGPASIRQGPSNIGGVINLISTPIPENHTGMLVHELGDNGFQRTHSYAGFNRDHVGAMLEVHHSNTDGFDIIQYLGGNTGFDKSDYLAKLRLNTAKNSDKYHEVLFKLKTSNELSNQTYVGLTQADYFRNPRIRYGLSHFDEMDNDHDSLQLNYLFEFRDFRLTAVYFDNEFSRDWFKVENIHGQSINGILSAANRGDILAIGILNNTIPSEILMKHNYRNYDASGINLSAALDLDIHTFTIGYRDMKDEEDRQQSYETFNQYGDGTYSSLSPVFFVGGSDNSRRETEAKAFYIEDEVELERLSLTLGYRSEEYSRSEILWSDVLRNKILYLPKTIKGNYDLWGFGATFDISKSSKLVFGFHEGRSPVFGDDAEAADNFELGIRLDQENFDFEFFLFQSNYSNLVAECKNSDGGECNTGDAFSGGAVDVQGIEVTGSILIERDRASYPIAFQYTKTDSAFNNSFESEYFGVVSSGDNVPYLPSSNLALVTGISLSSGIEANLRMARVGKTCSTASCNEFNLIEAHTLVDIGLRKSFADNLSLYITLENVLDDSNIVARSPKEGIRTQKPRSLKIGLEYRF